MQVTRIFHIAAFNWIALMIACIHIKISFHWLWMKKCLVYKIRLTTDKIQTNFFRNWQKAKELLRNLSFFERMYYIFLFYWEYTDINSTFKTIRRWNEWGEIKISSSMTYETIRFFQIQMNLHQISDNAHMN